VRKRRKRREEKRKKNKNSWKRIKFEGEKNVHSLTTLFRDLVFDPFDRMILMIPLNS